MTDAISVLLMLPPWGESPAERWMASARLAAAQDLIERFQSLSEFDRILVLAAEAGDAQRLSIGGAQIVEGQPDAFHFGRALAATLREQHLTQIAYFGGASAPLLTAATLREVADRLMQSAPGTAIVNNLHSTDWAFVHGTEPIYELWERFPVDNAMGWVLQREAAVEVHELPPSAATRLDLDTPADALLAVGHPDLGRHLEALLRDLPGSGLSRRAQLEAVLMAPAKQLTLIGRVAASAWKELGKQTQSWVRVYSEERGMVASGRHPQGQVRSLIADLIREIGVQATVERLAEMADGVLWDTRVWMSARGGWPPAAQRYASDLGWAGEVQDAELRVLTESVERSAIPLLLGGHGVVSGGLLAMLETLQAKA